MTETVLGIPGLWDTREKLMGALMSTHGTRFMLAGDTLLDTQSGESVQLQEGGFIPSLVASFRQSGVYSDFTEADYASLGTHKQCLFLVEGDGGSLATAAKMVAFGQAILQAGGLAVKVESSGKSHTEQDWLDLDPSDVEDLFWAYVMLSGTPNRWYSCGMHNLGLPDISLGGVTDSDMAATLVDTLARYLLIDEPDIQEGESFGLGPNEPAFRMTKIPCAAFPTDDPYHNPFGLWEMTPVESS